jgi:hypothetical protein
MSRKIPLVAALVAAAFVIPTHYGGRARVTVD